MRGYAKIKENNPFSQRSKSKKEYPFLDQDFDVHQEFESRLDFNSSNFPSQKSQQNEQKPSNFEDVFINKNDFFSRKPDQNHDEDLHHHDLDDQGVKKTGEERRFGGVLRRNLTVSSSSTSKTTMGYQKNGKNNENGKSKSKSGKLERQSSTRAVQEAVKRAFSMRRSSSVNNSERYSRIFDQPNNIINYNNNNVDEFHHNHIHNHNHHKHKHNNVDVIDFDNVSRSICYDDYVYDYERTFNNHHHQHNHEDGNDHDHDQKHDDHDHDYDDYDDNDEDLGSNNGSMETRYMGLKNKKKSNKDDFNGGSNNGKKHVGSKVVKACKRLFSR